MTATAVKPITRTTLQRMAREELKRHGFAHLPLRLGTAKRTLGTMHFSRALGTPTHMTLSATILCAAGEAQARDTILHEIAHAIAGHKAGHGPAWKAACRKIGADPSRTASLPQAVKPKGRYGMTCTRCGFEHEFYRRPTRAPSSYQHKGCGGTFTKRGSW